MMAKQGRTTRATPTAQNRGTQARPGDATGAENARLRAENDAAIREAATKTTLVNPPLVQQRDDVVDYSGGGSPNLGQAEEQARVITMEEALGDGETVSTTYDEAAEAADLDSLPDGKTDVLPEILERAAEEPAPAHGERRDSQQQVTTATAPQKAVRGVQQVSAPVVEQAHRVLRVNTDLEDITIGKDNHFTFRVGQAYKVPAHVYDHLLEKGYVTR
jgi:hypothetical protein